MPRIQNINQAIFDHYMFSVFSFFFAFYLLMLCKSATLKFLSLNIFLSSQRVNMAKLQDLYFG